MALSEKHRSSIYQTLSPVLGEEEAEALLSQFPARDLDEPITQGFVRAEIADVRTELGAAIADVRAELGGAIADVRAELGAEIADVRAEIAGVRAEIAASEARLTERLRQQTVWFMGALVSGMGLVAAIVAGVR